MAKKLDIQFIQAACSLYIKGVFTYLFDRANASQWQEKAKVRIAADFDTPLPPTLAAAFRGGSR
jgi:hypothetical protein